MDCRCAMGCMAYTLVHCVVERSLYEGTEVGGATQLSRFLKSIPLCGMYMYQIWSRCQMGCCQRIWIEIRCFDPPNWTPVGKLMKKT
jgi:hypothetical protein